MQDDIQLLITGDASVAARYVGFAKAKVNALRELGLLHLSKTFIIDDVTIRIKLNPVGDKVFIDVAGCSVYMESGYARLSTWDVTNLASYEPARIFLGPQSPSPFGFVNSPNYSDTSTFVSGDYSPRSFFYKPPYVAGGLIKAGTAIGVTGTRSAHGYILQEEDGEVPAALVGTYPISEALYNKKLQALGAHPSVYSGKLRLLIQARLGAPFDKPPGTIETKTQMGAIPWVAFDGVDISTRHDGLFTSTDGSFWLVSLSSFIYIRKIKLSSCGKAIMQHVISSGISGDDRSKLEAYALSTATLDPDFYVRLPYASPGINPVAYGWKWNWAGDEASCISLNRKSTGAHNTWYESTRQTLTLSRNATMDVSGEPDLHAAEAMRWSSSYTSSGAGEFNFPWGRIFMWIPLYAYMAHARGSGVDNFEAPYYGTGAVYGWYDKADAFQTVSVTHLPDQAVDDPSLYASWPPGGYVWSGMSVRDQFSSGTEGVNSIAAPGGNYVIHSYNTSRTERSIDVGDASLDLPMDMSSPAAAGKWSIAPPGWANAFSWDNHEAAMSTNPDLPYLGVVVANMQNAQVQRDAYVASGWGGLGTITTVNQWVTYSRASITESCSQGATGAIVIPFFDCEACYIFTRTTLYTHPTAQSYGSGISNGDIGGGFANYYWDSMDASPYDDARYGGLGYATNADIPDTSSVITSPDMHYSATVAKCHSKHGVVEATPDNLQWIFDATIYNDMTASKPCWTFTSAVFGYKTGTDLVSPSHPDFNGSGGFIGWF